MSSFMSFFKGHSTTASGSIVKEVICEDCGNNYFYEHKVTAQSQEHFGLLVIGATTARNSAQQEAEYKLFKELSSPAAVPCPQCGHYQQNMRAAARAQRFGCILLLGYAGLILAILPALWGLGAASMRYDDPGAGIFAIWLLSVAGLLAGTGLVLLSVRFLLNFRFDPNSTDVNERIGLGKQLTLSSDEIQGLKMLGE